jgi:prepilin-type N-terminal cleavage/methylation domain-containing protein
MKNSNKGFTLLELLVVVAIIGILASVVMGMLTNARKKSQDSALKEQMTSLRSEAELFAIANNNSYNNLFIGNGTTWGSSNANIQAILNFINQQTTVHTAGSSIREWAVQAQLKEDPTKYVCIDHTAVMKIGTNVLSAGNTLCP